MKSQREESDKQQQYLKVLAAIFSTKPRKWDYFAKDALTTVNSGPQVCQFPDTGTSFLQVWTKGSG